MSSEKIKVAVVSPVYNRRDITLQCLRSLSRVNARGLDIHFVIVDDASPDGTADAISKEFPEVEIVSGTGDLWFTEGTNVGVRAAMVHDPKYVLMMNDDQVFDSEFLRFLVETAEKYPRSVVGPILLQWDQPHRLFQTAPVWNTLQGGWHHWSQQTIWTIPKKPWKVDLIVGNCVLVPAEAIRECGLMNSKRYPNFGDAEYTPRLRRRGWQLLIDPRSRVFCQPNTLPPRIRSLGFQKQVRYLFSDLKHPSNLRRRFYAYWDGAPTRISGLMAFILFFGRVLLGKNPDKLARDPNRKEALLKDIFQSSQVEG